MIVLWDSGNASLELETVDYQGRTFTTDIHIRKDPSTGPGWYIFGRCTDVSANVIKLIARPSVKSRKHPHYNIRVRRGWMTKRAAEFAAVAVRHHLEANAQK